MRREIREMIQMKMYLREELKAILVKHRAWLEGDESGVRAVLRGADLRGADLRDADLQDADLQDAVLRGADLQDAVLQDAVLRGADLRGADLQDAVLQDAVLRGADLRDADLQDADLQDAVLRGAVLQDAVLRGADLRDADLQDADLRGADLRGADLRGADLRGAVLRGASGLNGVATAMTEIVPRKGSFSGWKKADIISSRGFAGKCVVELRITEDAARSNASGRKCRCSKADVVSIAGINGEHFKEAFSSHDPSFVYRVGETVEIPDFCEDRWAECAPGIHFFLTPEEAWAW